MQRDGSWEVTPGLGMFDDLLLSAHIFSSANKTIKVGGACRVLEKTFG